MSQAPMEYVDAGGVAPSVRAPRPPRRWLPVFLGLAAFMVVLVGVGAVIGDWTARNLEMRSLITQVEASESAMGAFQDSVKSIADEYNAGAPLSEADRAQLDARLEAAALQGRDEIAAAGENVSAVRWLLWHQEIGDAQEAYLAHNRAWQDYLNRASKDPAEFVREQEDINSTFTQAEVDVRAAVPLVSLFDLDDRVDSIFAPPPVEEGAGQQA